MKDYANSFAISTPLQVMV